MQDSEFGGEKGGSPSTVQENAEIKKVCQRSYTKGEWLKGSAEKYMIKKRVQKKRSGKNRSMKGRKSEGGTGLEVLTVEEKKDSGQ